MNDETTGGVHWSFWAIGTIMLIWNIMGVVNFFAQMNADVVAAMPETHRAIIEVRPVWGTIAFAIAVFGGVLGCLLLLLRKSVAYYLFIASLLGVIVATAPHLHMIGSTINDPFEIAMMMLMPLLVAVFLIWYSKHAESNGWIR